MQKAEARVKRKASVARVGRTRKKILLICIPNNGIVLTYNIYINDAHQNGVTFRVMSSLRLKPEATII
jgi:hypothetical protein